LPDDLQIEQEKSDTGNARTSNVVIVRPFFDRKTPAGSGVVPIDLVFLDGWKDLYSPVLDLLRPKLRKGSVVVADNIRFPPLFRKTMALYVAPMNDPANRFQSLTLPLGAGIEYPVFEGRESRCIDASIGSSVRAQPVRSRLDA
jgi:hypothetical protein